MTEFITEVENNLSEPISSQFWINVSQEREKILAAIGILSDKYNSVNYDMGQRKSSHAAFKDACLLRGQGGNDEYLRANIEYEEWRRRAKGFKRLVEIKLSFLNPLKKKINREHSDEEAYNDWKIIAIKLATAIRKHKLDEDVSDDELYEVLDTNVGNMSIERYLILKETQ